MRRRHTAAGLSPARGVVLAAPTTRPRESADIVTQRLLLRPVDAEAARAVVEGREPEGLQLGPGYPTRFSLDLLSVVVRGTARDEVGPFFVIRRDDRALVGEIGCRIEPATGTAHVGYTIAQPCWNLGYASEALQALLEHLIADVGVPRVEAETLAAHGASRRVMEKAGMRVRSQRRGGGESGRPPELVSYEAVAGEWSPPGRDLWLLEPPIRRRRTRMRARVR